MPDISSVAKPGNAEHNHNPKILLNLIPEAGKRESIPVLDFLSRAPISRFSMSFTEACLPER
jgi:hypothetical protein